MYFIVVLVYSIICALITQSMNEKKGYDGGFLWGFFLGIIGIIVVACRPFNQARDVPSPDEETMDPAEMYDWICWCGTKNPGHLQYCSKCNRFRHDADSLKIECPYCGTKNKQKNDVCIACNKPLKTYANPATLKRTTSNPTVVTTNASSAQRCSNSFELLEQLAKLKNQGILTEEEFQNKKSEILATIKAE